jgi:DNA polymerase III delta prime subunit
VASDALEQTTTVTDVKNGPRLQVPAETILIIPTVSVPEEFPPEIESTQNNTAPSVGADKNNVHGGVAASDVTNGLDIPGAPANIMDAKPKKILRLNPKTGTIGSPPAKKSVQPSEAISKTRSAVKGKTPVSRIVIVQYGRNHPPSSELGHKIQAILDGAKRAASFAEQNAVEAPEISKPPKSMKIAGTGPATAPHPFFLPKAPAKLPSPRKEVEAPPEVVEITSEEFPTLGRARHQSRDKVSPEKPKLLASVFSGLGTSARMLKFPGAIEPSWPWKGMTHVRGSSPCKSSTDTVSSMLLPKSKKSKYQAVEILADEDILGTLTSELCVQQVLKDLIDINPDEYPPLPSCLRVPTKHFEAGPTVQRKVRKELKTQLSPISEDNGTDSSEDEIQGAVSRHPPVHAALMKLYNSIPTSLSAFDKSQCETQAWTQKYAPSSAVEVLQTGREAIILKEWLQNLTVMAVESGSSDRPASRASSLSRRLGASKSEPSGKRKRKSKKLDGFVISSDEEEDDMDEISEPEAGSSTRGGQGFLKRTVIRASNTSTKGSKDAAKFCNGVVISGPHGCGKSAAVYAVAKELGFEVFEINSSSRRSGKDIIEKVGDMTRNHLVQQSRTQVPPDPIDEDAKRISDALDDDLKSGRQGTMSSFFQPKESSKAKPKAKKPAPAVKKPGVIKQSVPLKAPPKKQKQSLILFEEVDVLYEEDKQFWATVTSLLIQSKRPIIMTCTDESAVPLQMLSLHAILRFSPPPIDLATDYLLLVAASEGHIVRRDAVNTLYESRGSDLRASITDINFWCQFAVGSFKGGLDWFYPRWPPGTDVDRHGKTIRVVSEGTYERGMGLLSRDFLESHAKYLDIEEEVVHEAWDGWCLDAADWVEDLDLAGWAEKIHSFSTGQEDIRATLAMYDDFAESMSAADCCSTGAFSHENQVLVDTSLPALSLKVREDYVLAHGLIEATPLVHFRNLGKDISIWMKSRTRNYLQVDQHIKRELEIPTELDRLTETQILDLIRGQSSSAESFISRSGFSLAFDPIAEPEKASLYNSGFLEASTFDRSTALIATDVAPFVRSIVSYDARLQQERARLSNLLSEGGRRGKRMRTTRAAMSALEGGARSTTRKERYFGPDLNPHFVLNTGVPSWLDAVDLEMGDIGTAGGGSSKGNSAFSKVESEGELDELESL